jgi:hypothetical protein
MSSTSVLKYEQQCHILSLCSRWCLHELLLKHLPHCKREPTFSIRLPKSGLDGEFEILVTCSSLNTHWLGLMITLVIFECICVFDRVDITIKQKWTTTNNQQEVGDNNILITLFVLNLIPL